MCFVFDLLSQDKIASPPLPQHWRTVSTAYALSASLHILVTSFHFRVKNSPRGLPESWLSGDQLAASAFDCRESFHFSLIFERQLCHLRYTWLAIFPLQHLNISDRSFLACRVSAEKSAESCIMAPVNVICFLSLTDFSVLLLYSMFDDVIVMHLGQLLFGLISFGDC
jgi:hypothetical protein